MVGVSRGVLLILWMGLASGCGGKSESSPATHPDTDSSGGSGPTSIAGSAQGGAVSVQAGAVSVQDVAGSGGMAPKRCKPVDGHLAYGPIGEPRPLPLETVASGDCANCSRVQHVSGFRTAAGYGFVWSMGTDKSAPGPNLFSLNVDPNFEWRSAPRALVAENSALKLKLVPGPNGFVATTCSRESKQEWIQLNGDLDVVQGANFGAPDAPCEYLAPSVLWTGEVYLTSYSDSRGLVVASLDEQGALIGEQTVGEQIEWVPARFAKNGDRVLFVFAGAQARYAVFDLRGTLLGEVQPMGEENSIPIDLAIAPNRDGWWVVTNAEHALQLTKISQDGLGSPTQALFQTGYYDFLGFTPSVYGGFLLVGTLNTGGRYSSSLKFIALIGDEGTVDRYEETEDRDAASWPLAVVLDPMKDLIVESPLGEGFEGMVNVQEYGCLN